MHVRYSTIYPYFLVKGAKDKDQERYSFSERVHYLVTNLLHCILRFLASFYVNIFPPTVLLHKIPKVTHALDGRRKTRTRAQKKSRKSVNRLKRKV